MKPSFASGKAKNSGLLIAKISRSFWAEINTTRSYINNWSAIFALCVATFVLDPTAREVCLWASANQSQAWATAKTGIGVAGSLCGYFFASDPQIIHNFAKLLPKTKCVNRQRLKFPTRLAVSESRFGKHNAVWTLTTQSYEMRKKNIIGERNSQQQPTDTSLYTSDKESRKISSSKSQTKTLQAHHLRL